MNRHPLTPRRGTVLIAVLVCMGIAVTLLLGAVQSSERQRRQLRREIQLEQARWLLDAGLSKAVSQVRSQPDYDGETLSDIPGFAKYPVTEIKITVNKKDQKNRVGLLVTARLGSSTDSISTVQRSKEIFVRRK